VSITSSRSDVILIKVINYCNMLAAARGANSADTTMSVEEDLERLDNSFIKVD
jgi:hypothetical protein